MTKGVLLFAQNNSSVDYTKMAVYAAKRVKHFLKVPVAVVTNDVNQLSENDKTKIVDSVIEVFDSSPFTKFFYDGSGTSVNLQWNNVSRSNAYNLSPFDETLVIDVDYIINSGVLSYCWNQPHDLLIYKDSFDLAQWRDQKEFQYVSEYSIPFYWATAFWFRKTQFTQALFDLVSYIKTNWAYYKSVYQIHSTNFRNDYGFSIALHLLAGNDTDYLVGQLPSKMYYITDRDYLLSINDRDMSFLIEKEGALNEYIHAKTHGLDVHVMNKFSLLRAIEE